MKIGRPGEAVQQAELGLQEDPLNILLRINRASASPRLAAPTTPSRDGATFWNSIRPVVLALFNLAGRHASLGEWDRALTLCEEAYVLAPLSRVIGLLAGVLKRTGDTSRADQLLRKLEPADAFGVPWASPFTTGCSTNSTRRPIGSRRPSTSAILIGPICCGFVWSRTALHAAMGRADAEAQSARIVTACVQHLRPIDRGVVALVSCSCG